MSKNYEKIPFRFILPVAEQANCCYILSFHILLYSS